MDTTTTQAYAITSFALYAPILALIGACITFLNSRLNEAKTPTARKRVWANTVFILDMLIFTLGSFLCFSENYFKEGALLLILNGAIGCWTYYRGNPKDAKMATVLLVVRLHTISLAIPIALIRHIIPILGDIVKILKET